MLNAYGTGTCMVSPSHLMTHSTGLQLMRVFVPLILSLAFAGNAIAQTPAAAPAAPAQRQPWQDESLSFEQRAANLVSLMTLEEKVSQMMDRAPAIPRLNIPEYNWWNEALHGVARAGLATSFPQAIGMAATWDDSLMFNLATVISDEARAKYHDYIRRGEHQRYQGLTFWSPNINLFRDPRWGRGQETYGEDPFLTGHLAVQFIHGLQGDDPRYFKTVATVKHFAVHSGPEPDRHTFDAVVSERDLRESYLPHFETGIRAGAYSLMCAYNRIDGHPACGNDMLLKDILRGEWGFSGYIVSDCGAIDDMYLRHRTVQTAAQAAALGVRTGTDLDCGRVYPNLVDAVHQGLITEAEIDRSVTRLFLARFRLGMFDDQSHVRWASTPISTLDSPANRQMALRAARESMVLLRNQGNVLPLRRDLRTIAVIGPNADQWRMLLGNYNGIPADPITPLRGIREAVSPATRVLYARGADLADSFPVLEGVPSSALHTRSGGNGLDVAYFSSRTAMDSAPAYTGVDSTLDADWQEGAPRTGMDVDNFGVRWTGAFRPPVTGSYRLSLVGTVKFQMWLDDSLIVRSVYPTHDGEFPDPRFATSAAMQLQGGRDYRLKVEGTESYGEAALQLQWSSPNDLLQNDAVAAAQQADAVVMFLGLTARLEGEEMRVQIPGFQGGDRTRIDLPDVQEQLLERIVGLGKPTVLVLLNGSALAVNWAQSHVPGIIEAWYPGQAGGTAIADVLFGNYNPGGRLPVTFYKSVSDLPAFDDYRMAGRTYRFFTGQPLYPFGFGLSYTTFRYGNVRTSANTLAGGDTVTVSVDVTNSGRVAGDEVVQLYVKHLGSAVTRPNKDLRGYRRITLQPGETRTVTFPLAASSLAYWNEQTHGWTIENENVQLQVGASSADIRRTKNIRLQATR